MDFRNVLQFASPSEYHLILALELKTMQYKPVFLFKKIIFKFTNLVWSRYFNDKNISLIYNNTICICILESERSDECSFFTKMCIVFLFLLLCLSSSFIAEINASIFNFENGF